MVSHAYGAAQYIDLKSPPTSYGVRVLKYRRAVQPGDWSSLVSTETVFALTDELLATEGGVAASPLIDLVHRALLDVDLDHWRRGEWSHEVYSGDDLTLMSTPSVALTWAKVPYLAIKVDYASAILRLFSPERAPGFMDWAYLVPGYADSTLLDGTAGWLPSGQGADGEHSFSRSLETGQSTHHVWDMERRLPISIRTLSSGACIGRWYRWLADGSLEYWKVAVDRKEYVSWEIGIVTPNDALHSSKLDSQGVIVLDNRAWRITDTRTNREATASREDQLPRDLIRWVRFRGAPERSMNVVLSLAGIGMILLGAMTFWRARAVEKGAA
ncbi:MAG: hypothetical protein GY722_26845 [bacterium]|nr:hypothetical protein [bacterium]